MKRFVIAVFTVLFGVVGLVLPAQAADLPSAPVAESAPVELAGWMFKPSVYGGIDYAFVDYKNPTVKLDFKTPVIKGGAAVLFAPSGSIFGGELFAEAGTSLTSGKIDWRFGKADGRITYGKIGLHGVAQVTDTIKVKLGPEFGRHEIQVKETGFSTEKLAAWQAGLGGGFEMDAMDNLSITANASWAKSIGKGYGSIGGKSDIKTVGLKANWAF